jgi:4-hydroxy-tetrahydrodipicolinate synthase
MVALVTPMKADESVDFDALEKLIEFHIKSKTKAIVAMGTTGESATLDFEEHREVVRFVVDKTAGRIPVIAGTGANSTTEAIELTEYAKDVGADACLLVIGRLASIQNIVGVKEATGDVGRVAQIKALVGDDFDLYTGDDGTAVDFLLAGGHGGISVTANVAPQRVSEVYDAAVAGDAEKARELDAPLTELHKALFVEANPIPVKWAMMEMGLMGGAIRLPLTPLSEKYHEVVRQALRTAGAL